MTFWCSLYFPSAEPSAVAAAFADALEALGYAAFNPFGLLPTGRAYGRTVRLFVAPRRDGWVRVIGQPDSEAFPQISARLPFLELSFDVDHATVAFHDVDGAPTFTILQRYLRPDVTAAQLHTALTTLPSAKRRAPQPAFPLPENAPQVDPARAEKLINRFSKTLLDKAGVADQEEAARILLQQAAPDWSSSYGQQIEAVAACLTLPAIWRTPDFVTLRDAYALHERRRRSPNAPLYPGDAEALQAVPDALAYTPLFYGRESRS